MTAVRAGDSRARIVFLGSGAFGRDSLRRLAARGDVSLVGVVTAPPRPAGRGRRARASLIEDLARELGIETILTPERLRAPESVAAVLALEPELLVLADYGQIVPGPLLELDRGALNLHPSLLPRHRGATPIPAAILADDAETGVTLMRMDEGLDTGRIVAQERVALDGTETAPGLEAALEIVAADVLDRSLGPWLRGELEVRPQPEAGTTITRPLRRADGRLDPGRPAAELERQVRAYQPWPGSFVDAPGGRLVVWAAHAIPASPDDQPGTLVADGADGIALATSDGRLRLDEVQPAGGRRMPGDAYRRGLRVPVGQPAHGATPASD